jgi:hypothetical protein
MFIKYEHLKIVNKTLQAFPPGQAKNQIIRSGFRVQGLKDKRDKKDEKDKNSKTLNPEPNP